jgi:MSHA biogenesis protein MshE
MSLHLVVAQRLVRLVCEECATAQLPTVQQKAWLSHFGAGGAAGAAPRYARGLGCSRCNGTGYAGRSAVYEMLEMTSAMVDAANAGAAVEFVRLAHGQIAGETLLHHALALAAAGRTTLDEAMRVSAHHDG